VAPDSTPPQGDIKVTWSASGPDATSGMLGGGKGSVGLAHPSVDEAAQSTAAAHFPLHSRPNADFRHPNGVIEWVSQSVAHEHVLGRSSRMRLFRRLEAGDGNAVVSFPHWVDPRISKKWTEAMRN
jgi:hypothetical protein